MQNTIETKTDKLMLISLVGENVQLSLPWEVSKHVNPKPTKPITNVVHTTSIITATCFQSSEAEGRRGDQQFRGRGHNRSARAACNCNCLGPSRRDDFPRLSYSCRLLRKKTSPFSSSALPLSLHFCTSVTVCVCVALSLEGVFQKCPVSTRVENLVTAGLSSFCWFRLLLSALCGTHFSKVSRILRKGLVESVSGNYSRTGHVTLVLLDKRYCGHTVADRTAVNLESNLD